ncbi:MAG: hypothetical protein M1379_05740 [Firmicutes bacterium]|nr:hypothetical protein [Bacillota bacterium]
MKRDALVWLALFLAILGGLLAATGTGARAGEKPIFSMADPSGDDYGAGAVVYPSRREFQDHPGLFDLKKFQVAEEGGQILFVLAFGEITNPWSAPEGFFHQLVDIYIDSRPEAGRTDTLRPGANVRFSADFAWDLLVQIRPFGKSAVYDTRGRMLASKGQGTVSVGVMDKNTIRLSAPKAVLGAPSRGWRYYVLVGGYDPFGPDQYRAVQAKPGAWLFGGGEESAYQPNVVDLLAPKWGGMAQEKQLRGARRPEKKLPVLFPVGVGVRDDSWWLIPLLMVMGLVMVMAILLQRMKGKGAGGGPGRRR